MSRRSGCVKGVNEYVDECIDIVHWCPNQGWIPALHPVFPGWSRDPSQPWPERMNERMNEWISSTRKNRHLSNQAISFWEVVEKNPSSQRCSSKNSIHEIKLNQWSHFSSVWHVPALLWPHQKSTPPAFYPPLQVKKRLNFRIRVN